MVTVDPDTRAQLWKSVRLWALAVVCASAGAGVVWRTDNLTVGVLAFLTAVGVLGVPLWAYERSRRTRDDLRSQRSGSSKGGRR